MAERLLQRLSTTLRRALHKPLPAALVILGMHRSGTSVTTHLLHELGLRLDEALVPPAADNPRGFWESRRIVDLHEELLATLQRSWKRPFLMAPLPARWWSAPSIQPIRTALVELVRAEVGRGGLWGFKDPRTARLLPLWQEIFAEARVEPTWILVFRHPSAVIRSLVARNNLDPAVAELLWIEHNLDALEQVDPKALVAVDFDRLAQKPASTLSDLRRRLRRREIVELASVDSARVAGAIFFPDMVHHQTPAADPCSEFTHMIHARLVRLAADPGSAVSWPDAIAAVAARDVAKLLGHGAHRKTADRTSHGDKIVARELTHSDG